MDIQRYFEILELDLDSTPEEAQQAYKDMVNIWHPDRFNNNPRLKQKAEERLKEINTAYETVKSFLCSRREQAVEIRTDSPQGRVYTDIAARDKVEDFFEAGTEIVLKTYSSLSRALHGFIDDRILKTDSKKKKK